MKVATPSFMTALVDRFIKNLSLVKKNGGSNRWLEKSSKGRPEISPKGVVFVVLFVCLFVYIVVPLVCVIFVCENKSVICPSPVCFIHLLTSRFV